MKILIAAALVAASPAVAQECGGYADAVATLYTQNGQTRATSALTADGRMIAEMWANPSTGAWTLLLVMPSGLACRILSGDNWKVHAQGNDV